jgi:putative two-component system response regulator
MEIIQDAKILIVEDQETNIRLLKGMLLREGYTNVIHTDDSRQALPLYLKLQPDLMFLDLHMPHLSGFDVMEQLCQFRQEDYVPLLVLTCETDSKVRQRALLCGAMDFIAKPFNVIEVLLRARNFLEMRQMHLQMKAKTDYLEEIVRERTARLENSQIEMMQRLADAAECHDVENSKHTHRVAHLAARLGHKLGMSEAQVALLQQAAALHDIGKIAVPDHIWLKKGTLTSNEFEIMKTHAEVGARLLQDGQSEVIQMAETIALTHHEHWDGGGYPYGLGGEDIPLVGRVVALADVFDALLHERPYKMAWPIQEAREEIIAQSGKHFDPKVVEAFVALLQEEHGLLHLMTCSAPLKNSSMMLTTHTGAPVERALQVL